MESNVRRVHEIGFTQQDSCETWANSRNEIDFKHKNWDLVEVWQEIETP